MRERDPSFVVFGSDLLRSVAWYLIGTCAILEAGFVILAA